MSKVIATPKTRHPVIRWFKHLERTTGAGSYGFLCCVVIGGFVTHVGLALLVGSSALIPEELGSLQAEVPLIGWAILLLGMLSCLAGHGIYRRRRWGHLLAMAISVVLLAGGFLCRDRFAGLWGGLILVRLSFELDQPPKTEVGQVLATVDP